jgi:hypothetical protein
MSMDGHRGFLCPSRKLHGGRAENHRPEGGIALYPRGVRGGLEISAERTSPVQGSRGNRGPMAGGLAWNGLPGMAMRGEGRGRLQGPGASGQESSASRWA